MKTHKNDREGSREALCFHSEQILQLGDDDMHSRCCGEASHQRLREIDRHKTEPEKSEDELKEVTRVRFV